MIIEVTGFHTLWKFVLNDLVHFKVWYKHQWSSKAQQRMFQRCPKRLVKFFENQHALFSIILPQISFIKPQFSILNSSTSSLGQKYGIFDSKCPQLFPGVPIPIPIPNFYLGLTLAKYITFYWYNFKAYMPVLPHGHARVHWVTWSQTKEKLLYYTSHNVVSTDWVLYSTVECAGVDVQLESCSTTFTTVH